MNRTRIDTLDPAAAGAYGAREEAAMPARVEREAPHAASEPARARRTWLGFAARAVRDAAIAVAFMAMVPIALVVTKGDRIWGSGEPGAFIRTRVARAELVRPFALKADPSITPMEAGLAFASMQSPSPQTEYAMRAPTHRPAVSWRDATLSPGMFPTASTRLYNGPSSQTILQAVAAGFTPEETSFLRTLATAPVWRAFDLVARAPAVDIIGGRFRLPFANGLSVEEIPLADYKATKEMAYAAVSRAAYHMSIGQRDSAETILRSIASFGFVLIDNGTTFMDQMAGNVIVGVGRDALYRFYTITHDPRAGSNALALTPKGDNLVSPALGDGIYPPLDEVRAKLLARVANPAVHRTERYELLRALSASSCTNVPELLFGQRSDVTNALANARRDLARYPSEQAVVDLIAHPPSPKVAIMMYGPLDMFVVSAGTVAGTVLRNPRLATCARLTTAYPSLF